MCMQSDYFIKLVKAKGLLRVPLEMSIKESHNQQLLVHKIWLGSSKYHYYWKSLPIRMKADLMILHIQMVGLRKPKLRLKWDQ
jgi:hypothetical protein